MSLGTKQKAIKDCCCGKVPCSTCCGGDYPDTLTLSVTALDAGNAMCQCWDGFELTLFKTSDGTEGDIEECEVEYTGVSTDPCTGITTTIRFFCSGLQDLEIDGISNPFGPFTQTDLECDPFEICFTTPGQDDPQDCGDAHIDYDDTTRLEFCITE